MAHFELRKKTTEANKEFKCHTCQCIHGLQTLTQHDRTWQATRRPGMLLEGLDPPCAILSDNLANYNFSAKRKEATAKQAHVRVRHENTMHLATTRSAGLAAIRKSAAIKADHCMVLCTILIIRITYYTQEIRLGFMYLTTMVTQSCQAMLPNVLIISLAFNGQFI
jgi:hypothetical protein